MWIWLVRAEIYVRKNIRKGTIDKKRARKMLEETEVFMDRRFENQQQFDRQVHYILEDYAKLFGLSKLSFVLKLENHFEK